MLDFAVLGGSWFDRLLILLNVIYDQLVSRLSSEDSSSKPFFSSAATTCCLVNPISMSLLILPSLISGEAYFLTQSAAC